MNCNDFDRFTVQFPIDLQCIHGAVVTYAILKIMSNFQFKNISNLEINITDGKGLFYKYIQDFCAEITTQNNVRMDGMAHEICRCDIPIPMDIIDLPGNVYGQRH